MTRRFEVLAWGALLFGSLAVAIPAGAESRSDAGGIAGTFLVVEQHGGNFAQDQERLEIGFRFESVKRAPGRITLYVPSGFAIGSNALPGTPLGSVSILTADPFEVWQGSIAVLPLDMELVDRARSCTDREPSAAWALTVEGLERRLDVPLYVSPPGAGDPASAALRVDFCLAALAQTPSSPTPVAWAIGLTFRYFRSPGTAGSYVWPAIVAPLGSGRRGVRPGAAYELRATVPVPQRLTLTGRYLAGEGMVLLTGSLRTRGRARARVPIELIRLDRVVTNRSVIVRDAPIALARTSKKGTYSTKFPIRRTSGFLAYAWPVYRACGASELAPGGCVSNMLAGVESDPVTVGVP